MTKDSKDQKNIRKTEDPSLAAEEFSNPSDIDTEQLSQNLEPIAKVFKLTAGAQHTFRYAPKTDRGNAARLKSLVGSRLRCVTRSGRYLFFNGRFWEDITGHEMKLAVYCMDRLLDFSSHEALKESEQTDLYCFALKSQSRASLRAMLDLFCSEPGVSIASSELDKDIYLLNVQNGTVDLRKGILRPHSQDDLITKISPVSYDPLAECPRFMQFLDEITLEDKNLQGYLQRMCGYMLTGDTSEQCLFFLYGVGQNGKSKMLGLMEYISGPYSKRTGATTLMKSYSNSGSPSPELVRLKGARIVLASELDHGDTFSESLIKDMSGGEPIVARGLYQNDYEQFEPEFKLIFGGNHKPKIHGTDDGIWRRIHLIPFLYKVPADKRDAHIEQKLKAEASGVLGWMIQGYIEWQRVGLQPPELVKKAVAVYRKESSPFEQWLEERCVLGDDTSTSAKKLYDSYVMWSTDLGEKPMSQNSLGRFLSDRFSKRNQGGIIYDGIGLRPQRNKRSKD